VAIIVVVVMIMRYNYHFVPYQPFFIR